MILGNGEKIGVLGGGQLGLMLYEASVNFNVDISFLDPDPYAPCSSIVGKFVNGDFRKEEDVLAFGIDKDIVTIEIEDVNTNGLRKLKKSGVKVFPNPDLIDQVKDKGLQKQFLADHQIPTSNFEICTDKSSFINSINRLPVVQKLRTGGYDGRGVQLIKSETDYDRIFVKPSILEDFVDIEKEISVIVSRNRSGEFAAYPAVGMDFNQEANLVEYLYSPAGLSSQLENESTNIAIKTAEAFDLIGIMAVEMFVTKNNILVNEVAPRPHNSGHHSIEGNITSQYEQHLRAILDLPLGETGITKPSVMLNLLGSKGYEGPVHYIGIEDLKEESDVFVHLYGKQITRPFRKMGHVTVLNENLNEAILKAKQLKEAIHCKA